MSFNDDKRKRELAIEEQIRRRNLGLETEGVIFAHKISDSWELALAARDAREARKKNQQVVA